MNVEAQWQQASPSRQLVAEMMILAGEIAGKFGAARMLPLPYRGQASGGGCPNLSNHQTDSFLCSLSNHLP